MTTAPLVNPAAQHLITYWGFVKDYLFLKSGRKVGQPSDSTWMEKDFARAQKLLGFSLVEFYKAIDLSAIARFAPDEVLPAIKKWMPTFQNQQLADVIMADALSRIKVLKTGDAAPNFVLPDVLDSLVSLRSLRGNVVLLCFWFPGCKPCVEEFLTRKQISGNFRR